jgi:membrane-associated phospholipid phosphatase
MAMKLVKDYRFIDYITQGYVLVVGLLILFFHRNTVAVWPVLLAAHALVLVGVHYVIKRASLAPENKFFRFLRHFYPILLYTGFYRETGALNQMFIEGVLDPFFIRLEERLFGCQPSLEFMTVLPYRWAAELMYAAYFSYYVMIVGIGLTLFLRDKRAFDHYVSTVSFVFYMCYLTYIFLPVVGPRLFSRDLGGFHLLPDVLPPHVPEIPEPVQSAIFFKIMAIIYDIFESPGAAFPSSHVAVAICTLFFTYKYLKKLRLIHAICVLLLCASTVYGRYHYVVDVIGGALVAAILVPIANWCYNRFGGQSTDKGE